MQAVLRAITRQNRKSKKKKQQWFSTAAFHQLAFEPNISIKKNLGIF
jgi:hypothetical protein